MKQPKLTAVAALVVVATALCPPIRAQEAPDAAPANEPGLAQELTNPVADLLTIPIQMNFVLPKP